MRLSTILRMRKSDNGRTPENAEEGIYVYSIDGYLYTKEEWDTSKNNDVVGIGIIKNNHKFVVDITGFKDHYTVFYSIGSQTSVSWINNFEEAVISYIGYENTQQSLNNDKPTIEAWGKYASVYLCNEYVFKNGNRGYLLSSGELQIVIKNKVEINNLLQLVGGKIIDFNTDKIIVTSTPCEGAAYSRIWGYKRTNSTYDIVNNLSQGDGVYGGAVHFVCCKF